MKITDKYNLKNSLFSIVFVFIFELLDDRCDGIIQMIY